MTAQTEFGLLAGPLRAELLALCYRMLGSVHDAEDAVQETYLRAWRAYPQFAGRSSLRTWLYQIAIRTCLRSRQRATRRPLPSGLDAASADPAARPDRGTGEVAWLQPFPTAMLAGTGDPAAIVEGRASIRLAFVAALQHLSARQRAVLILREVLDWRAAEVAAVLQTTPAAVNSLLQRARAELRRAGDTDPVEPADAERRRLVDRYQAAFTAADLTALTQVLTDDAAWEMPPFRTWYTGRDTIAQFLAPRLGAPGTTRMDPTTANAQPAFACYRADADGWHPHALHVLTVTPSGIARVVAFMDPQTFPAFTLAPRAAPAETPLETI